MVEGEKKGEQQYEERRARVKLNLSLRMSIITISSHKITIRRERSGENVAWNKITIIHIVHLFIMCT